MTETIRPTDTAGDLLERLAHGGAGLLVATLDGIESGTSWRNRNPPKAFLMPRRSRSRTHASPGRSRPGPSTDWSARAPRAPGAWTTFRGERLKLAPVTLAAPQEVPGHGTLEPGTLLVTKQAVFVGTGTPARPARHRPGTWQAAHAGSDWGARGTRIAGGEGLGDE